MSQVVLGLIQISVDENPQTNLEGTIAQISQAVSQGAQLICLQELFKTRYFCREYEDRNFNLAEVIPGPTTEILSRIAKEKGVVIIAPLFERRTEGIYHNSAVVLDADGSIAGIYRKMHLPDDPHFFEKFYFSPGDSGFVSYKTRYGKVGVLICWDQWFPEAARLAALGGAQILFCPSAIGWLGSESQETAQAQLSAWELVQRSHAVANGIFVAAINRVGEEGEIRFWGSSFVADPLGRILAKAAQDRDEILIVKCDLDVIKETRQNWPFLRDRRIDAYGGITERFLDHKTHHLSP